MSKRFAIAAILSLLLSLPFMAWATAPIPPARIGGTVTVDGSLITQETDTGYTFVVTKQNGGSYEPAAEDMDGLNEYDFYTINIPIYDADEQLGGATPGETAAIHVYKHGTELTVTSPANGEFLVQESGSITQIDLEVTNQTPQPPPLPPPEQNHPPRADAGPDQTVDEGATVTLDGSNSSDPDEGDGIVSYLWSQAGGPTVTLSVYTAQQTTFVAPDAGEEGETLTFELTVTDKSGLQDTDTVIVYVRNPDNVPPVADAGPDQTVEEGRTVMLDGSNSSDPHQNGGVSSYLWTQTAGPGVALSNPTTVQPTFVAPRVDSNGGTLTFELKVTDIGGLEDVSEINITIADNGIAGFPDADYTFRSSTGKDMGLKVANGGNLTRLSPIDPNTISDTTNQPEDLIYGLIGMEIRVDPGGTASITIFLSEAAPEGYVWYKYDPTNGWLDYSEHASFSVGGGSVTLELQDGGFGDADRSVNGMIIDPSGIGYLPLTPASSDNGYGESGTGCFLSTLTSRN